MKHLAILSLFLLFPGIVFSAAIVGGSDLLTQGYANQLETWLGEGAITINKVYTKQAGHTAANFHAAANGVGRTFALVEVLRTGTSPSGTTTNYNIIGGYNPQSWTSAGVYNYTNNDADRDAFIFNLTNSSVGRMHQKQTTETGYYYVGSSYGHYQTLNQSDYGPSFSAWDLMVYNDLNTGFSHLMGVAYGADSGQNMNVFGIATTSYHTYYDIGKIEVFTITNGIAVPEMTSLWGLLLGVAFWAKVRFRK